MARRDQLPLYGIDEDVALRTILEGSTTETDLTKRKEENQNAGAENHKRGEY